MTTSQFLSSTSVGLNKGDVVCASADPSGQQAVTLATPAALLIAGAPSGIALEPGLPGRYVTCADPGELVSNAVTGVPAAQGIASVSTTGRVQVAPTLTTTGFYLGNVNQFGILAFDITGNFGALTSIIGITIYGGGENGNAVFDGVNAFAFASLLGSLYTLSRDVFLTGGSVAAPVSLDTGGFRVFCNGTFTNNGVIMRDGKDAVGAVAGASSTLGSIGIGMFGGNGRSANTGLNGNTQPNGLQDLSATGGAGGAGGVNNGGLGGLYTFNVAGNGGGNFLLPYMTSFLFGQSAGGNSAQAYIIGGGAGGGGGGSDNAGVSGGGGGGGAGVMQLTIFNFVNNGIVHANGGNGAAAFGAGGSGGGGGGGGGGLINSLSRFRSGSGIVLVNGGNGGAGLGAGGVNGTPGSLGHYDPDES